MAALCKGCKKVVNGFNKTMVMLHDDIWKDICDNTLDVLCDKCIEKRMRRKIQKADLKPHVFVNAQYIQFVIDRRTYKRRQKGDTTSPFRLQ